jgi:hypothetical protein
MQYYVTVNNGKTRMNKMIISCLIIVFTVSSSLSYTEKYSQEDLISYSKQMVENAINDDLRISDPDSFSDPFYSVCRTIYKYLGQIEDGQSKSEIVESLVNFPVNHYKIKSSIIMALGGVIDEYPNAYKYVYDSLSDTSIEVRKAAVLKLLRKADYESIKDCVIQDKLYSWVLHIDRTDSIKVGLYEYILNNTELNSDELTNEAKSWVITYFAKAHRLDLLPRIAYFVDDSSKTVGTTVVNMIGLLHKDGFSEATNSLNKISLEHKNKELRNLAENHLSGNKQKHTVIEE